MAQPTQANNEGAAISEEIFELLKENHLLLELSKSALLELLPPHFGNEIAQVLYDEIAWYFHRGDLTDTSDEDDETRSLEFAKGPIWVFESQVLAAFPGGTKLAIQVSVGEGFLNSSREFPFRCPWEYAEYRDNNALQYCRAILQHGETERNEAFQLILKARQKSKEMCVGIVTCRAPFHNIPGLLNPYFFKCMAVLAKDHWKRASYALASRVVDGRLPKELVLIIGEFYAEAQVQRMAKMKKEYRRVWDPNNENVGFSDTDDDSDEDSEDDSEDDGDDGDEDHDDVDEHEKDEDEGEGEDHQDN